MIARTGVDLEVNSTEEWWQRSCAADPRIASLWLLPRLLISPSSDSRPRRRQASWNVGQMCFSIIHKSLKLVAPLRLYKSIRKWYSSDWCGLSVIVSIRPSVCATTSLFSSRLPRFRRYHFLSLAFQEKYRGKSAYGMFLADGSVWLVIKKAISLVVGGPLSATFAASCSSKNTICSSGRWHGNFWTAGDFWWM